MASTDAAAFELRLGKETPATALPMATQDALRLSVAKLLLGNRALGCDILQVGTRAAPGWTCATVSACGTCSRKRQVRGRQRRDR